MCIPETVCVMYCGRHGTCSYPGIPLNGSKVTHTLTHSSPHMHSLTPILPRDSYRFVWCRGGARIPSTVRGELIPPTSLVKSVLPPRRWDHPAMWWITEAFITRVVTAFTAFSFYPPLFYVRRGLTEETAESTAAPNPFLTIRDHCRWQSVLLLLI